MVWTRNLYLPRHPMGLSMGIQRHKREPTTKDYYQIRTRMTTLCGAASGTGTPPSPFCRTAAGQPPSLFPYASNRLPPPSSPVQSTNRQRHPSCMHLRQFACARTVLKYRSVWDSPSLYTAGGILTNSRLWIRGDTVGSPLVSGCVEGLRGPEGTIIY